jgi:hypothetical protein
MRNTVAALAIAAVGLSALVHGPVPTARGASHREAPLIIADPLVDNTDTYAFRSYEPGRSGYVTLMANFIPFQPPYGGPHFFKFDDTALYEIKIDNTGDGVEDVSYQFQFNTTVRNPDIVLGMASPTEALKGTGGIDPLIASLNDIDYNEPQTYLVRRVDGHTGPGGKVIANGLLSPPCNIGPRTTPNYEDALASKAVYDLQGGGRVFVGQRDEGFYIDVSAIFDTLKLRSVTSSGGVDSTAGFNVGTIAIEVPIEHVTRTGKMPDSPTAPDAVIGVWSTASRRTTSVLRNGADGGKMGKAGKMGKKGKKGKKEGGDDEMADEVSAPSNGAWRQVSRLGNPLVNEVVIPLGHKDHFNASSPKDDAQFASYVVDPQLPKLMAAVFGIKIPAAPRNDLVAIFATGIGVNGITGPNFTTLLSDGKPHEMLRLNVAIPPSAKPSRLGLLGGDVAGFPNGRRVFDDVTDIGLRAMAGGTPFTGDTNKAPNSELGDGVENNDMPYLDRFPYLGTPHPGSR